MRRRPRGDAEDRPRDRAATRRRERCDREYIRPVRGRPTGRPAQGRRRPGDPGRPHPGGLSGRAEQKRERPGRRVELPGAAATRAGPRQEEAQEEKGARLSVQTIESGRYTVERRLGGGGMAVVYLARDEELDRLVAVKVLAENLAGDEEFRERFLREARMAARLSHPNVVSVFDAGEDDGRPYIVMEYVNGEKVADELERRKRFTAAQAVDLALQVCGGLDHAHAAGLVHRDVKPGNLLRREDGLVKIADFGIAPAAETTDLAQVGTVLGTVATAVRTMPYPVRRPRAVADRRLWLAVAAVLAVVAIVLGLALARNDTSSSSPPRAPSVALVPAASTPAERARNLAAWLRRYS